MTDLTFSKIKHIDGWLGYHDFEIFRSLICFQNEISDGALAEIGVHRGKSFALIGSFSINSKLYAIDIFGNQELNIDSSGSGDREQFLYNVKGFGIDENRIVIDPRMSNEVVPEDIINSVGQIRFFHIDGGHYYDAVLSDLRLAVAVGSRELIIAIDDVFRPEWPEVTTATFGSDILKKNGFVMFAIGFNKTYFCRKEMMITYQEGLRGDNRLTPFMTREYDVGDQPILVFQKYPLTEWRLFDRLKWYFSVWHPKIYLKFWRMKLSLKRFWSRF